MYVPAPPPEREHSDSCAPSPCGLTLRVERERERERERGERERERETERERESARQCSKERCHELRMGWVRFKLRMQCPHCGDLHSSVSDLRSHPVLLQPGTGSFAASLCNAVQCALAALSLALLWPPVPDSRRAAAFERRAGPV